MAGLLPGLEISNQAVEQTGRNLAALQGQQAQSALQADLPAIVAAAKSGDFNSALMGLAKHDPSVLSTQVAQAFGLQTKNAIDPSRSIVQGAQGPALVTTSGPEAGTSKDLGLGRAVSPQSDRESRLEQQSVDKFKNQYQRDYNREVKSIKEATRYAKQGLELINSKDASKMMGAIQFMAVRASGSNSQLSDGERAALSGLQDLASQMKQLASTKLKSEFIKENKDVFKELFSTYMNAGQEQQEYLADSYSSQLKELSPFKNYTDEQALQTVTGKQKDAAASLTPAQEAGIANVMKADPGKSKADIIKALKKAGKL